LSARQTRLLFVTLALAVALTRLLAAAHSLWEWDETLFCLSLHDFNVAAHHPHPPGFPLYVVLGRFFRLFVHDDFRALRAINLLCSMTIFPGVYFVARELRMEAVPAMIAALLTCFAPNIWFYGGTAFSDIPALAMLLFGIALLLRGRRSRAAYFAGCVLMAAACVMRPQNVLLGIYPWLAASWPRWKERKLDPIFGAAILVLVVGGFFFGAALMTGFDAYRTAVKMHGEYVMKVDSYMNPERPVWYRTYWAMLLDPYEAGRISGIIAAIALAGLLRFRRPVREALVIFGPFVLFSMFMLNTEAGGRYATTSMALLMICCAEGLRWIAAAVERRSAIAAIALQCLVCALIVTRLIRWSASALREVRVHDAPVIEAERWIHRHLDRATTTLYVHGSMGPWAEYLLKDYRQVAVVDNFSPLSLGDVSHCWLISEGVTNAKDGLNFTRPRGHLWSISRKRYFDVFVRPLSSSVAFADGWYGQEGDPASAWRWMGRHSTLYVPAIGGNGELSMKFNVPLDSEPRKPVITIMFNGVMIERFSADAAMEKRWVVPSRNGVRNEVTIDVDEVVNPSALHKGGDARDLGLQLLTLSWRPAETQ